MTRTAYVAQKGAVVRREGELLNVYVGGKREGQIAVHDLAQIVLMGNVLLTPGALDLLIERRVDTVLLTLHGKYRARLVGPGSHHITLRIAQYETLRDAGRALGIAKAVVRGKIANQRTLLMRHARQGGEESLRRACVSMQAAGERLELAGTLDEARGCEGSAAAAYFRVFGALIKKEGFRFDGRNRRPPMDPVNALLSLGYTFLANAVEAAVHVVGLDAYLGALHAPEAGRPSLVCDLEEEFRAPVVDALVLAAIHREAVVAGDFEDAGEGEPVVMKPEAVKTMARLFERRLARPVRYERLGVRLPWRQVIEQQARAMARCFLKGEPYEAFTPR